MIKLIIGGILTAIAGIVTYFNNNLSKDITVNIQGSPQFSVPSFSGVNLVFGMFGIIGLIIFIAGIIEVIKNWKTNVKGEECFGKIHNIYPTGTYVNGVPELKAEVLVYIPSLNETKLLSEIIGVGAFEYQQTSYVKVKYYNNDINIIGIVHLSELPVHIKDKIAMNETNSNNQIDVVDFIDDNK